MNIEKEIKEIQELVDMLGSRQDREDFAIISNFIKKQKAELEKKDRIIKEMVRIDPHIYRVANIRLEEREGK